MKTHASFGLCAALLLPVAALAQLPGRDGPLPTLAPLVESVKSTVVNVDVQASARASAQSERGEDEDMLDYFFRRRSGGERGGVKRGAGSGFIIDAKGLVLTNNHVVDGAVAIRVRLDDGRAFDADVLGKDPLTDLALLRLKGKLDALPVARLGDSGQMRVGDWVLAIGNPFGLASSVSVGIVSALDRNIHAGPYDQFLQTDAAINPGNSGGPLFNLKGEVIGINTAIVGGGSGIGFAVPSNVARALVPQLEQSGAVTRGWLGVGIQDLTPALGKAMGLPVEEGALLTQVNSGSPASKSGLKEDDVVVTVDGQKVGSSSQLSRTIALKRPDSTVRLGLYRAGKLLEVPVLLGTRPDLENLGVRPGKGRGAQEGRQQRLGLSFQDMDPRMAQAGLPATGALVVEVAPGSPAEQAGLRSGMVIVEAKGRAVRGRDDLARALSSAKPQEAVLLKAHAPGSSGRTTHALEVP